MRNTSGRRHYVELFPFLLLNGCGGGGFFFLPFPEELTSGKGAVAVGGGGRCCEVKALSEILLQSKQARRSKQATAGQGRGKVCGRGAV